MSTEEAGTEDLFAPADHAMACCYWWQAPDGIWLSCQRHAMHEGRHAVRQADGMVVLCDAPTPPAAAAPDALATELDTNLVLLDKLGGLVEQFVSLAHGRAQK